MAEEEFEDEETGEIEESEPEDSDAEEGELEEELEEETPPPQINLNNFDFGQLVDFESDAPVLERIAGEQTAGPRFVSMIGGQRITNIQEERESDENTYLPSAGNGDENTYIETGNKVYNTPEIVEDLEVGRRPINDFERFDQREFLQSSERDFERTGVERVNLRPERVDMQRVGRKNPFEQEKEQYKKYDFERRSH